MMSDKVYYEDFIGFYENRFPDRLCNALVEVFSYIENDQCFDIERQNTLFRNDFSLNLLHFNQGDKLTSNCSKLVLNSFFEYADNYSILKNCFTVSIHLSKTTFAFSVGTGTTSKFTPILIMNASLIFIASVNILNCPR